MTPLSGTEELKGDFWFILADNVLYGFEVDENGESGTQPHNSVQMKFELKIGTADSLPESAVAFKGEVRNLVNLVLIVDRLRL